MSFAKRLKMAMAEREMSQAELAAHIGKGKSSVSQYLSGKNIPKDDVQQEIAKILDCTVEFLNSEECQCQSRNVSISQAAKRIGKSEKFLRIALQENKYPFGRAVKMSSKYTYQISPKLLDDWCGK